jgi:hypothetical protein
MSVRTRENLLKQLGDQGTIPTMPAAQTASAKAPDNPFEAGFQKGDLPGFGGNNNQQPPPPRQPQVASINPATISNPIVKIAGLILGSPEFQRQ